MNKLIIILSVLLSGCIAKTPPIPKRPSPDIIITGDPVEEQLVQHIVKRTEHFCQQKKHGHVTRVTINHNSSTRFTSVKYRCEGDYERYR